MSDDALKNAETQRDQLLERVRSLKADLVSAEARLKAADQFIFQWHAFAEGKPVENVNNTATVVTLTGIDARLSASGTKVSTPKLKNSNKEDVARETRLLIEEQGVPMMRKELLPLLRERGLRIEGGDPDMVLSTMLWRAGEAAGVVHFRKGGYWLKEKDWPASRYYPNLDIEIDLQDMTMSTTASSTRASTIADEDELQDENPLFKGR